MCSVARCALFGLPATSNSEVNLPGSHPESWKFAHVTGYFPKFEIAALESRFQPRNRGRLARNAAWRLRSRRGDVRFGGRHEVCRLLAQRSTVDTHSTYCRPVWNSLTRKLLSLTKQCSIESTAALFYSI